MKNLLIRPNDAGQRLDRFLAKVFPAISKVLFYKLIRKKQIVVNHHRATPEQILAVGDVIEIFNPLVVGTTDPNRPFLHAQDDLHVVYEDDNIIVVDKPSGLLAQAEGSDNLVFRLQKYLYQAGMYDPGAENQFAPTFAHRIDQNTSGLVVGAKNAATLQALATVFREHWIQKTYLALVHGILPTGGTVHNWLQKADKFVTVWHAPVPGAKPATTRYTPLRVVRGKYTLVEVQLETGRTHQIRATFNDLGYPLVGEQKYTREGVDKDPRFRSQALLAYQITFRIPDPDHPLAYLNGCPITLPRRWLPF